MDEEWAVSRENEKGRAGQATHLCPLCSLSVSTSD